MSKKAWWAILGMATLVIILAILYSQQYRNTYSRNNAERDLSAIKTLQEEYNIFFKIAKETNVDATLWDSRGKQVYVLTLRTIYTITSIEFNQWGKPPILYKVKYPGNILMLFEKKGNA